MLLVQIHELFILPLFALTGKVVKIFHWFLAEGNKEGTIYLRINPINIEFLSAYSAWIKSKKFKELNFTTPLIEFSLNLVFPGGFCNRIEKKEDEKWKNNLWETITLWRIWAHS